MEISISQQDHWHDGLSTTQARALAMLGQGVAAVMVAGALGVSESLISQFLADPRYAEEVTKRKLAALQTQTNIDNKYALAEEKLLDKFIKTIPLISKPMEIVKGLQVINATKRRGAQEGMGSINQTTNIVQINLPAKFAANFIKNAQGQIVEVQDGEGSRSLITTTPQDLDKLAAESYRATEISVEPGWEASSSSTDLLRQASKRLEESGVSETIPKGLRRSFEAKGAITENDL